MKGIEPPLLGNFAIAEYQIPEKDLSFITWIIRLSILPSYSA